MKNINFLKEPGYLFDLFWGFALYFNRSEVLKKCKSSEEEEYYVDFLDHFGPISEELLLFFCDIERERIFFVEKYFTFRGKQDISERFHLSNVLKALADYEKVIDNVILFYFDEVTGENLVRYRQSLPLISQLIKESKYSWEVKSSLYAFFIDPVPIIQKLVYELMAKDAKMKQLYEKSKEKIEALQKEFDYDVFYRKAKKIRNTNFAMEQYETIYVSFCVYCKKTIQIKFYDNALFLLLGANYMRQLDYVLNSEDQPALDAFGNVLSEKNRIEILNLILKKGEATTKEVEQELGLTGTNTHYHLMLMHKTGLLQFRNQGRTMLYRINKEYFESIIEEMKRYTK